jgi:hypothetical protein
MEDLWTALKPHERFKPLQPYFDGLIVSDIDLITRKRLDEVVEPNHRLLVISFWNMVINPYITQRSNLNINK